MLPKVRITLSAALLAAAAGPGFAEVEQRLAKSIKLPGNAIDIATTADGQRTFVLLAEGKVELYNAGGAPLGQITVPAQTTAIAPSPDGSLLYVTAGDELRILGVDLVHQIDVAGSPFRGPEDAPVTVTVFNDFQ